MVASLISVKIINFFNQLTFRNFILKYTKIINFSILVFKYVIFGWKKKKEVERKHK